MGTKATAIARGSATLVIGQLCAVAAQVLYGAITARLLDPAAFGSFAIAISFTSLLSIVTTSGLMTFVLAPRLFSPEDAWLVWSYVGVCAAVGAGVTWWLAPTWAALWHTPGAAQMLRWLSLQVLLNAFAVGQSCFLRRERRALADSLAQSGGAVIGLACGVCIVVATRSPETLVASPVGAAAGTLTIAALARRIRYPVARPASLGKLISLQTQISLQNLFFFAMSALPTWLLGRAVSNASLGRFSRASVIPMLTYNALSTGLMRGLQPYYRHLESEEGRGRAVADVALLTGAVSLPFFGAVAALAHPIVQVWLGARWLPAANYVTPLAAGYGLYTVFAIVANASETLNYLAEVRRAQCAMLPGAVVLGALTLEWHSAMAAAFITVVVAYSGLVRLVAALHRCGLPHMRLLLLGVTTQFLMVAPLSLAAWILSRLMTGAGISPWIVLPVVGLLYIAVCALSVRFRPEWYVIRRRQLLQRSSFSRLRHGRSAHQGVRSVGQEGDVN